MDDIFFSDNPNQKKKNTPAPDKFSADLFSGETEPATSKRFTVHLPDDASAAPNDRTPRGKPVGEFRLDDDAPLSASRQKPVVSQQRRYTPAGSPQMPEYTPPAPTVRQSEVTAAQAQKEAAAVPARAPQRPTQGPNQRPTQRPAQAARSAPPPRRQPERRRKKPRHVKGKIIAALLALVLLVLVGAVGYGYVAVGKLSFDKEFERDNPYISQSELMHAPGVKNILFIGSDARGDVQGQRSDTMLICSIDSAHHKVKLTSLLRDSFVYIPSKGYSTKLNAAFSYGGANLLVDTVESNFKIKIDDYVLIDFEGFVKLIDSMGGLDVDGVTENEARYLRDKVKIIYAKEGKNHFSGKASLWYCRIRYLDDDFHRTERQRKVIHAIINQALRKGPFKLMKIVDTVMPYITTSMNRNDVPMVAASAVFNFIGGENPQHQIPAEGTWTNARIGGADVLKMDTEENVRLLKEFVFE
ncbi:MAG: LCP family protein [Clostridia bacterium]|nr:LCP family protein [Clostridia bacterium]